jgi:hypothetical protein
MRGQSDTWQTMEMVADEDESPAPRTELKRPADDLTPRSRKRRTTRSFRNNMYDTLKMASMVVVMMSPTVASPMTQATEMPSGGPPTTGTFRERAAQLPELGFWVPDCTLARYTGYWDGLPSTEDASVAAMTKAIGRDQGGPWK